MVQISCPQQCFSLSNLQGDTSRELVQNLMRFDNTPLYGEFMTTDNDLRPPRQFSGGDLERFVEAIVDSYDLSELTQAIRFEWGEVLANRINTQQPNFTVAADLLSWTERKGRTIDLLGVLYRRAPDNPKMKGLAKEFDLIVSRPPKPTSLQSLVNTRSRFIGYDRFLRRYTQIGGRVCKILSPNRTGTGTLVGNNLVLTNFHVLEEIFFAPKLARSVRFHFSYPTNGVSQNLDILECALAKESEWHLKESSYSESDISGEGSPDPNKLDYALVKLDKNVGDEGLPNGVKRGWFNLEDIDPIVGSGDFIVVAQHPKGIDLQVAWGQITEAQLLRLRHDATTDEGSSGALCFNTDLEPFGLHHATEPAIQGTSPRYNQCIPLRLVAADLKVGK